MAGISFPSGIFTALDHVLPQPPPVIPANPVIPGNPIFGEAPAAPVIEQIFNIHNDSIDLSLPHYDLILG